MAKAAEAAEGWPAANELIKWRLPKVNAQRIYTAQTRWHALLDRFPLVTAYLRAYPDPNRALASPALGQRCASGDASPDYKRQRKVSVHEAIIPLRISALRAYPPHLHPLLVHPHRLRAANDGRHAPPCPSSNGAGQARIVRTGRTHATSPGRAAKRKEKGRRDQQGFVSASARRGEFYAALPSTPPRTPCTGPTRIAPHYLYTRTSSACSSLPALAAPSPRAYEHEQQHLARPARSSHSLTSGFFYPRIVLKVHTNQIFISPHHAARI
ncbi:hypothetical protein K438DRAFT_2033393 [Mycena galopus ATCC 62051]|nr:hypothetical protein K438DRAFT_2033393 [Mycena galopus ATCC 62051]